MVFTYYAEDFDVFFAIIREEELIFFYGGRLDPLNIDRNIFLEGYFHIICIASS